MDFASILDSPKPPPPRKTNLLDYPLPVGYGGKRK